MVGSFLARHVPNASFLLKLCAGMYVEAQLRGTWIPAVVKAVRRDGTLLRLVKVETDFI